MGHGHGVEARHAPVYHEVHWMMRRRGKKVQQQQIEEDNP